MTSEASAPTRLIPLYWFLIFAVLFSIQVLPRLSQDAVAGDETLDVVDGFYYWKGDVISTAEHPPLAKALQALPLLTMGLKSKSGLNFSGYSVRDAYFLSVLNKDHFEQIITSTRFVTFLFGLALGALLFFIVRSGSMKLVITVMTLWAFEPLLLAFSGFALADMPVAFFFLLALWQFQKLGSKCSWPQALLVGLFAGMAITTKYTAFLLLPTFFILEAISFFRGTRPSLYLLIKKRSILLAGTCFWICLVYMAGTIGMVGHPAPWTLFFSSFQILPEVFKVSYYFKGVLSQKTHWDYYLTAFGLKSPLPFLLLLATSLILALIGKIRLQAWQWLPVVLFFSAFLFLHDIGLRMILPVYPFCILMAGQAGEWMTAKSKNESRLLSFAWAALLAFQVFSVGISFPYPVSYFNELVSPERRLYWLGDSNLDMGQDTKRLALAAKAKGWEHIKLAYIGPIDPKLYGMDWSYWTQKDLENPQPGWVYVINDEYIQLGPAFSPVANVINRSWIMRRTPTGTVGDTWYYFEVPGNIQKDKSPHILSAPIFVDSH